MSFPQTRLRRLRKNEAIRRIVTESFIRKEDLIMPLFVCPGQGIKKPISSMPNNFQCSIDVLVEECQKLSDKGILSILLFGIPEKKDEDGTVACQPSGIVQRAIQAIKKRLPDLYVIADVCNCEYTTHGHCGTLVDGDVDNDLTLITLAKQSVSLGEAGVDMVAPSDMMDGRVGKIREELDKNGFSSLPIMSYAAKFASGFYGPFREAAESVPQFGNRSSYQMNPANGREALQEVELDIQEGADIVMIKPAMCYLDIIRQVRDRVLVPVAAYNVSGEFSMLKAAAERGWLDENRVMMEMLLSIKRAGADIIITYFAPQVADLIDDIG